MGDTVCRIVDGLILIAESKEKLIKKLNRWKDGWNGEITVNINNTKVMTSRIELLSIADDDGCITGWCIVFTI